MALIQHLNGGIPLFFLPFFFPWEFPNNHGWPNKRMKLGGSRGERIAAATPREPLAEVLKLGT